MNRTIRQTVMAICMLPMGIAAYAQQDTYLSLHDALEAASQHNRQVQMSELDRKIARANFHQTDAIFLPQVSVGYTALTTNNPLNAFGFLLQQENVTAADFDPAKLNHPGASQHYNATAEVQMPLLNADLIFQRKGAKKQSEMYRYQAEYMKDYIRFEVQKAYTQLQFAYQAQKVLHSTLHDVTQIYQTVQNFYGQGLVQKSDVLNAQVQVNTVESALAKAESSIIHASDALALLMNRKDGQKGTVFRTDSLEQRFGMDTTPHFSLMRADVMAMQKALDASDAMVRSAKMNFLPKINAFANYQFNDAQIFRFQKDSYLAGISLSWTLYSGNRNRSKLKAATLQRDKMKMQLSEYTHKSRMEIDKTHRDLKDLLIEIRKQETSVEQAAEALRILNDRYSEGLVSTTDLLAAQAQLSQQRLGLAQTIMNYNITRYYQELLTTIK